MLSTSPRRILALLVTMQWYYSSAFRGKHDDASSPFSSHDHCQSYRSHNCHTSTPSSYFTHPISCNTAQRKCLEIVQYRVKFSKSSISLSSRHGLRDDAEVQKGLTVMAVPDRGGYDPIKQRHSTTLDTLRTYDENSRSCSGFHSRQFQETDEDGG